MTCDRFAQLILWLGAGILTLLVASGIGLYGYVDEALERSLDAAISAKADAIAGDVQIEGDGQPHLESPDSILLTSARHEGPFYFQIWRGDGSTIARSAPNEKTDTPLPRPLDPHRRFINAKLPDGTPVRVGQYRFIAQPEEDEQHDHHSARPVSTEELSMVVVHDRRAIDGPLEALLTGLLLTCALVTIGTAIIVTIAVRRGLRPLAEVSALADRIGPDSLDVRFPGKDTLPPELLPISRTLNELLDRVGAAFDRERRFSAAVAHELRTPLAELRAACDVALRWPDDAQGLATALSENRDVAVEMSVIVQTLLSLARQQAGTGPTPQKQSICLTEAISEAYPDLETAAMKHGLALTFELDQQVTVEADMTLLKAALRNLLENAVDYAPAGSNILIRTQRDASGSSSLQITNPCDGLTCDHVAQMFEPFWRADPSRSRAGHTGLGLTLVKAYCEAMGITARASRIGEDRLTLMLEFPQKNKPRG